MSNHDSRKDTEQHIENVRQLLSEIILHLAERAQAHDASKLQEPEKSMYDEFTPKLRDSTYGSDEYKGFLRDMGAALQHHYQVNSHHPEHFENGVNDMSLLDIIEMLADWTAAVRRHADGSIRDSLKINKERFSLSDQLYSVLCNTAVELGWIPSKPAE